MKKKMEKRVVYLRAEQFIVKLIIDKSMKFEKLILRPLPVRNAPRRCLFETKSGEIVR